MEGLKGWNGLAVPDLCRGSAADREMKQDAGLMNAHLCLPRLMLPVQTPGGNVGRVRACVCNCLRCSCVSAGKQWERIRNRALPGCSQPPNPSLSRSSPSQ